MNSGHTQIPTVHPGNTLGHRLVTRIAVSRFGISTIQKIGPYVDPVLVRLSRGRLSLVYPFQTVLLTHTGAKSGVTRTTPIVYFTDGDRIILIASAFGSLRNPAWYYNIRAHPDVTLYGRGITGRFRAVEVRGAERDELFNRAKSADTPYSDYERMGERYIPVIALHCLTEDN